MLAKIIQ
jgi:hypothetical protein